LAKLSQDMLNKNNTTDVKMATGME